MAQSSIEHSSARETHALSLQCRVGDAAVSCLMISRAMWVPKLRSAAEQPCPWLKQWLVAKEILETALRWLTAIRKGNQSITRKCRMAFTAPEFCCEG